MRRIKTKRAALAAYGILLVLPALVLGGLYWSQIQGDYEVQLAAAPGDARDAARRVVEGMQERLEALLESEGKRPFSEYGSFLAPDDAIDEDISMLRSPLSREEPPEGILAWFSYDRYEGPDGRFDVYAGGGRRDRARTADFELAVANFREHKYAEGELRLLQQLGDPREIEVPMAVIAVNKSHRTHLPCLRECEDYMRGKSVLMAITDFYLQFYREADGTPRAIASRRVLLGPQFLDLPQDSECLQPLNDGIALHQGFLIDVDWLLEELPEAAARQVLRESERLVRAGLGPGVDESCEVCAEIFPVKALGFQTYEPDEADFGRLELAVNTELLQSRHRAQMARFAGVAAMLVVSLLTGMFLIQRSVQRDLEQAQRTQNFVSAVTHELRTPLAAIRLHAEMLLERWTDDPEKQREYHRRIVRETRRLTTMVERVLEQGRLTSGKGAAHAGSLNALVARLQPDLAGAPLRRPDAADEGAGDLEFDLAPNLPPAMLTAEAVGGILTNLVENARKYAPFHPDREGAEPIRVRTLREDGCVVLEVADRGPGVPAPERSRIFDAFHRLGNEATRTSTGTGLGLHLVRLHAESVGARASMTPRPGGGSLFRVTFRIAGA